VNEVARLRGTSCRISEHEMNETSEQ
jgi:hypothetical protein